MERPTNMKREKINERCFLASFFILQNEKCFFKGNYTTVMQNYIHILCCLYDLSQVGSIITCGLLLVNFDYMC